MGLVRSLIAQVTTDTSGFSKGVKKAKKDLASFSADVSKSIKQFAKWGSAISVAAGAGLAVLAKNQAEFLDGIGKLSDRLDVSTVKLLGWGHAATLSGSSQDDLNKALEQLSRRIGEAVDGTGEGVQAFAKLRLEARSLANAGLDRSFLAVADAMRELGTEEERAAVAAKLFGRSGVGLVNTLNLGSAGLREMVEEATRFGKAITRLEIKGIERANDGIDRMKTSFDGLITTFTSNFAPAIEDVSNRIADFVGSESGRDRIKTFVRDLTIATVRFAGEVRKLVSALQGLSSLKLGTRSEEQAMFFRGRKVFSFDLDIPTIVGGIDGSAGRVIDAQTESIIAKIKEQNARIDEALKENRRKLSVITDPLAFLRGGSLRTPIPEVKRGLDVINDLIGLDVGKFIKDRAHVQSEIQRLLKEIKPPEVDSDGLDFLRNSHIPRSFFDPEPWKPFDDIDEDARAFSARLKDNIEFSLSDGIRAALSGDFKDALRSFADTLSTTVADAMAKGLTRAANLGPDSFEVLFKTLLGPKQRPDIIFDPASSGIDEFNAASVAAGGGGP